MLPVVIYEENLSVRSQILEFLREFTQGDSRKLSIIGNTEIGRAHV